MKSIEIVSFIFNALCVYYVIKKKTINWSIGIIGTLFLALIFFVKGLWGQFSLQIIFLIQGIWGYIEWYNKEDEKREIKITYISNVYLLILFLSLCSIIGALLVSQSLIVCDWALFALSLIANQLLIKRLIENWILWILIDAFSVYLFYKSGIYITAALYFVLLIMAVVGLIKWDKELKKQHYS